MKVMRLEGEGRREKDDNNNNNNNLSSINLEEERFTIITLIAMKSKSEVKLRKKHRALERREK